MERAIFLQAIGDYMRPRRLLVWLFVSGLGALLALALPHLLEASTPKDIYAIVSQMLVFRVVGLSAAIFATGIIGAEVDQRTIVYLLTRPAPRWKILVLRYLAAVMVVTLLGIFGVFAVSTVSFRGHPFQNPLMFKDVLAVLLSSFAYNGLFLFVSLLINRSMVVCLLYAFGWELVVPQMPGTMYYLSIYSHMQAVAQHPTSPANGGMLSFLAGMFGTNTLSPDASTAVLIIITIATLGAAAGWFTYFEFVPREDGL